MTTKLDLAGLECPLPPLKTRKMLKGLSSGDGLEVFYTDPLAAIDFPNLLNETGDGLESTRREGEGHVFLIRKK